MGQNSCVVTTTDNSVSEIFKWFRKTGLNVKDSITMARKTSWEFNNYEDGIEFYEFLCQTMGSTNQIVVVNRRTIPTLPMANVFEYLEEDEKLDKEFDEAIELASEAVDTPKEYKHVFGDGHQCLYSRGINEPRPRKCILCGKDEE